MLEGMTKLLPTAEVGLLGLVRDEQTFKPTTYAERLPEASVPPDASAAAADSDARDRQILAAAIKYLFDRGARRRGHGRVPARYPRGPAGDGARRRP